MKVLNILAFCGTAVASLSVDFSARASLLQAAKTKAQDVMQYYHGRDYGQTPGLVDAPYLWWQAGALWGTMIDYWKLTGDASFNGIVQEALLFQTGPDGDFRPPNVTAFMGHDDQSFWGMSAMLAAESGFQDPNPADPQWLALAQAVHNVQKESKAKENLCGGGLRWQVFSWSTGYNYKNTITNGAYFNLAARLARYTGDSAYAVEAEATFAWLRNVGLVDEKYNVFDGAHTEYDCKDINRAQFSYNAAILLQGSAFMWDVTRQQRWADHVDGILDSLLSVFFRNGVAFEPMCESAPTNSSVSADACTTDMRFYKGFVFRWMADTARLCPWTRDRIRAATQTSAAAAVRTCQGGPSRRACGMRWTSGVVDSDAGLGQEMNALSVLMTLVGESGDGASLLAPPLAHNTGGTSVDGADAGTGSVGAQRFKRILRSIGRRL